MPHPYLLASARHFGRWLLLLLLLSAAWPGAAQPNPRYTVRGRVLDARSEGLPGATVRLLNTVLGASSGVDGGYELTANLAPGVYQLEVSSVGYRPVRRPVTLGAETTVTVPDVTLQEDLVRLNDVVVTGTSVATSKKQLGNTIATVSGDELRTAVPTQIDQALQGKFAGVQITQNSGNPAGGISVRLRGPSTVAGSSDPLYIIDGVIVNNDSPQLLDLGGYAQNRLVDISPNDIERVEVIKGAAAAAIYGSRASNGVVQIFTKRGKEGKPQVTASSQFLVSEIRRKLPYNQYPFRFATFTATDPTQVPVTRYDYQDQIFRTATGTDNYVSITGGSTSTKYFASGNYFRNQGIVQSTDFSRGGGRVRLQQNLGTKASLSVGANYTLSRSREIPNGGINEAYGALTGFIFANNYIDPSPDPATGRYPSTSPVAIVLRTNPLEAINRFDFRQQTSRFIGDAQLSLTPFEGFSVDYVLGYDASTQVGTAFIPPNNTTPGYGAGYARRADRTANLINNDLTLNYRRSFAEWLQSTTTLGGTLQWDEFLTTGIVSQQLAPVIQTTFNGVAVAGEFRSERTIIGAFVQQTLGLGNRLFLTGAARVDAASVYGANNRTQFYPKLSGSYVVSEESFWKNSALARAVPQFKLRASWGQAGNLTAIGSYDRFTNFGGVVAGTLPGLALPTQLGNPNLKPERQIEFETGFDASFLNDRVGVEASYYNKRVRDLLLFRDLAFSSGYLNQYQNIGNMTNRGVEVLLRVVPVQAQAVRWTVTGTFTHNKNRITDIPGGLLTFPGGFGQVAAVEGQPLGTFYSTYFARNPDGSLLLTPAGLPQRERGIQGTFGRPNTPQRAADGQPSGTILNTVIGDPNPRYVASLINEVALLNNRLLFRLQFDSQQDFDVFNFTRRVGERDLYGSLAGYEAELRGEVPKGTSAALFQVFENWIEDGSFVKLREASVSYTLLPKVLGLRDLRLSVAGRNLLVFTDYSGYDPEVNAAGQSTAVRGFDFVEVPIPRTVSVGLNASF
ncbi:SusC/RagA family TonB-linked outer membrane protein [Hymenobacter weizhouensis]|uniref:SusC/RagA family TonB-linked outer membrane protein n=1 Tax=Hymenobacter sp. YIM 151500-1 TaxID=2987689 RepID=UPI0022276658|nr:SusC/RagA family TonB-linked outer membrane protein [Hymenobacter sp. YIM 151500-1]UYZ62917.1 SusC/RagA family TonB-linked outer membrane protein [Hymenobacter sp. YIM 151500-1]